MRKWITALAMLLTVLMAASACSKSGDNPAPSASPDNGGAVDAAASPSSSDSGEPKELKIRFYDDPAGFDPASIFRIENENIAFNIYSGLTTFDPQTGKAIPDLAESWESPDNKVWTCHSTPLRRWKVHSL